MIDVIQIKNSAYQICSQATQTGKFEIIKAADVTDLNIHFFKNYLNINIVAIDDCKHFRL